MCFLIQYRIETKSNISMPHIRLLCPPLLLLCSICLVLSKSVSLLENSVLSPLASSLGLETTSLHLILKNFAALCPTQISPHIQPGKHTRPSVCESPQQ